MEADTPRRRADDMQDVQDALFERLENMASPAPPCRDNEGSDNEGSHEGSDNESSLDESSVDKPAPGGLFTRLPRELLLNVMEQLANEDIKRIRLSCKLLDSVSTLRITRVFLSANPLNVKVFRAIADHEVYRHRVTEIIYDDAKLAGCFDEWDAFQKPNMWLRHDCKSPRTAVDREYNDAWFEEKRQGNVWEIRAHQANTKDGWDCADRMGMSCYAMELKPSYAYYMELYRQQEEVIASGADKEALQYGLRRFPSLRKVTVTPAAHGMLFCPLYRTPMIRAFPEGFNYPLPRGWPNRKEAGRSVIAAPWVSQGGFELDIDTSWDRRTNDVWAQRVRDQWRGCVMVVQALAQEPEHHVSELLIDSNQLATGLSCRLFEQRCEAYTDLVSVFGRPGFRRLHLSLHVGGQQSEDWRGLRSGLLRTALAGAVDMQHFTIETDADLEDVSGDDQAPPPLWTYIPVQQWANLQHLRLWNLWTTGPELITFLGRLPPSLRTLELGRLMFADGAEYHSLLPRIRSDAGLQARAIRPDVKIAITMRPYYREGRSVWLDTEINEFLYRGGNNPFDFLFRYKRVPLPDGVGIIRDTFLPGYEEQRGESLYTEMDGIW